MLNGFRKLHTNFGLRGRPIERFIRQFMDTFSIKCILHDHEPSASSCIKTVCAEATINAVDKSVSEGLNLSIRWRAQQ